MNVIDLLEDLGIQPRKVASCNGGEYHSPCPDPSCDGKDRFCSWPKEGNDGRYWCRQCLRSGDAIQFCRDFLGMDFVTACAKVGRQPAYSRPQVALRTRDRFAPKILSAPSEPWRLRAHAFIEKSHQYLLQHSYLLNHDKDRGLTEKSITAFQLGWNPSTYFEPGALWGLEDVSPEGEVRRLCIPQGIVIPSLRDNVPVRVKIRRHNWNADDNYPKYHIIAGGMTCPSLYGDVDKPLVIVEAELDAMLIQEVAGDLCCAIALGGVSIRPDSVIDQLLRKASKVLCALDFDESGKKAYHFWQSTYSNLRPWPVPKGKSPGDALALGVDLRLWILVGLKRMNSKINI